MKIGQQWFVAEHLFIGGRRTCCERPAVWRKVARRHLRSSSSLLALDDDYRFLLALVLDIPDPARRDGTGQRWGTKQTQARTGTYLTVESLEQVMNSLPFLGFQQPLFSSATWPLQEEDVEDQWLAALYIRAARTYEVCFMSRI